MYQEKCTNITTPITNQLLITEIEWNDIFENLSIVPFKYNGLRNYPVWFTYELISILKEKTKYIRNLNAIESNHFTMNF